MASRTHLPRQAAQAAKYTFDEPSDDEPEGPRGGEDSDEDEHARPAKKRKKGKGKVTGKKGRLAVQWDEEERQASSHIRVPSPPPEDVEYEVKRVDFSKVLPVEVIAEIFSYLQPKTLYRLVFLNRTFHALLSSPGLRSTWREIFTSHDPRMDWMDEVFFGFDDEEEPEQKKSKPKARDRMPFLDGKEVDPYRLAILLYETTCEFCGKNNVTHPDTFLLLRVCSDCRRSRLVPLPDLVKSKEHDGMHPATVSAVLSTPFGPDAANKYARDRNVLVTHFDETIDELEELQAADDADPHIATADAHSSAPGRNPSRAAKATAIKRARKQLHEDGAPKDEHYGPLVRDYLQARVKEQNARRIFVNSVEEIAAKIDRFCIDEGFETKIFADELSSMRRDSIRQHLANEGVFEPHQVDEARLARNPAASKPEPLNDSIWDAISGAIHSDIGRGVAKQLVRKYENKRKAVDWDAAKTSVDLLKQPSSLSDAAWMYVEAALKQLIQAKKDESDRIEARQRDVEELARRQKTHDKKNAFFRERYEKICAMLPSKAARACMPRFLDFLRLPTVSELYADDKYGIDPKRAEADIARFTAELDAVKAELDEFALDVRLDALKVILASTTEMTADEIEELDADALGDPRYGDAFFARPSSWLFCAECINLGTLLGLLQHTHKKHPRNPLPLRLDEETASAPPPQKPPVRLPLEVACAWSAIFELAQLDIDDPKITDKDLDRALEDYKLVWENGPRGCKGRSSWRELMKSVLRETTGVQREGKHLEPPVIALKDMTSRERRLAEAARKAEDLARKAKALKDEETKKNKGTPASAKVEAEKIKTEDADDEQVEAAAGGDEEAEDGVAEGNEERQEGDEAGADEEEKEVDSSANGVDEMEQDGGGQEQQSGEKEE